MEKRVVGEPGCFAETLPPARHGLWIRGMLLACQQGRFESSQHLHDEGGNVCGKRRDCEVLRNELRHETVEPVSQCFIVGVIRCQRMRLSPGGARVAEPISHSVCFSLLVLGGQAMGAVDEKEGKLPGNQLDCSKVDGAGLDLACAMNPAKGRSVVAQRQEALVLLLVSITFKDHQPHIH